MTSASTSPRLRTPQTTVDALTAEADRVAQLTTNGCSHAGTVKLLLLAACDIAVLGEHEHYQAARVPFFGSATKRRFRRVHRRANVRLTNEAKEIANGHRGTYPLECVTVAQRDDHDCRYATALLEEAGMPFNATQISDTVLARRRILFGAKAAARPPAEAVQRAVLHQIARDQAIRRYGDRAIWTTGPLDDANRRAEQWTGVVSVPAADQPDVCHDHRSLS